MIDYGLAFRSTNGLSLAPLFCGMFIILRIRLHQLHGQFEITSDAVRQMLGYKLGAYLCLLMLLISLLPWVRLFVAVNFNWNPSDVAELEIQVFSSSDPQAWPEQTLKIGDKEDMTGVFDGMRSLQPYSPQHEHAVGKSYLLRLRRRSDNQWSGYRVRVYTNEEVAGGLLIGGVYVTQLEAASGQLNLGTFRAVELGQFVEHIVERRQMP